MWVEQYAREKGVKAQPYTEMLSRIVTPAEFKVIETIRNAGYTCASLTSVEYDIIQFMMMSPDQRASLVEG